MTEPHAIFDRRSVRAHRDRAARHTETHAFLLEEMAERLCDRLSDIAKPFPLALDLGAHHGVLAGIAQQRGGVEQWVQADLSRAYMAAATGLRVVADEEYIPFAANSFDLVMSCGSLQWVNDVPGALVQIHRILKPGGLFLCMVPGGQTLKELRESFEQAEMAQRGGISPRVSPFIDVKDAGSLLQRAGFAEPVTDSQWLTVSYAHPLKLLKDLRAMGESNALTQRSKTLTPCSIIMAMADHYLRHYSDEQGRIPATFELVTMTGWKD
ncbi:MAG: methyltransferase domain-containing protein [Rickettsiales bacterium]|nr:methyltransferase domain-containing protein [Rickettsiales bacterium]